MAVISKGIKLSYKTSEEGSFTDLTNLTEIADLGGEKESIEITTLDDAAHKYTNGILNYGDSLPFKFIYEKEQFATLNALKGNVFWKVSLPDGVDGAIDTVCTFSGECSVKLDGVGTNAALTYELSIKPTSELVFA